MRVVNLSRRPFVNRRPIVRIAILLWIVAAVLLAVNVRLYTGHWLGSAENRRLLAEVRQKLAQQQQQLAEESQEFRSVRLERHNRRAVRLNWLIDARTFPWSLLFEDLEEVLPPGVRLLSVQPVVRLASAQRSRAQAERAAATEAGPEGEEEELARDEVRLRFNGVAQSFDQLEVFVDRLYNSPFRNPFLSNASQVPNQGPGMTSFSLSVVYLTRRPELPVPIDEPDLVEGVEAGPDGSAQDEPRQAGLPADAAGDPLAELPSAGSPPGSPPELEPAMPPPPELTPPRSTATGEGRVASESSGESRPPSPPPKADEDERKRAAASARPDRRTGGGVGFVPLPDRSPPGSPPVPTTRRVPPPPRTPPRSTPAPPPPRESRDPVPPRSPSPQGDDPGFGEPAASATPQIGSLTEPLWESWEIGADWPVGGTI